MSTVNSSTSPDTVYIKALKALRERQEKEFQAGVDSGKLTPEEQKKAKKAQEAVNKLADQAQADGRVTEAEMARIKSASAQADHIVYALVNNKVTVRRPSSDSSTRESSEQKALRQWRESREEDIQEGLDSGAITAAEQKRLKKMQESLKKLEVKALADGQVSEVEERIITTAQKRLDTEIYSLSRNKSVVKKPLAAGSGSSLNVQA